MKSELEESLLHQMWIIGTIVPPKRQYKFHPKRKWLFDFAWPDKIVAAECEGGIWVKGAHVRGGHFQEDCQKYNAAALLGWRVFRFTADMIASGEAINTLEEALK